MPGERDSTPEPKTQSSSPRRVFSTSRSRTPSPQSRQSRYRSVTPDSRYSDDYSDSFYSDDSRNSYKKISAKTVPRRNAGSKISDGTNFSYINPFKPDRYNRRVSVFILDVF